MAADLAEIPSGNRRPADAPGRRRAPKLAAAIEKLPADDPPAAKETPPPAPIGWDAVSPADAITGPKGDMVLKAAPPMRPVADSTDVVSFAERCEAARAAADAKGLPIPASRSYDFVATVWGGAI